MSEPVLFFPGIRFDEGFATILVAFVPALIGVAGFWLRIRHVRKRLAASLLAEVRLKLRNLVEAESWVDQASRMIESGTVPRLLVEARHDVIFDNHQNELTNLPTAALKRIVTFYKIDDFINIALEEVRTKEFAAAPKERQLRLIENVRTLLLPRARDAGTRAELALSIVSELTIAEELSFSRRYSFRARMHGRKLRLFKDAYRRRRRASGNQSKPPAPG